MLLTIHNRALLRGMLAGAVALGGVSACSRSDRADAGRDTTQTGAAVTPADTQVSTASQTTAGDTVAARIRDTSAVAPQIATPKPEPQPARPAAEPKEAVSAEEPVDSTPAAVDVAADTTTAPADSVTVAMSDSMPSDHAMADTAAEVSADTAAAGYEPMARDTSVALAQADTVGQVQAEVQADTTTKAQTELAMEDQPDTVTVVGDSSSVDQPGPRAKEDTVSQKADSLAKYHEAKRIRPPEDSTELLGNVTPERNDDVEAVGDANADQEAVGAAPVQSTGNIATGAEAVALMNRAGQPCRVEDSRNAAWDLASSPSTLNPCGTGTMTLPKVQTGEEK